MKKVVLITGASSGIGKATAIMFASLDFQVIATMRRVKEIPEFEMYENIEVLPLDVTSEDTIRRCITKVTEQYGRIDILINNAGYGLVGPFENATREQIRRQFETNVFGVITLTQAVLPYMRAQNEGVIITLSSIAGRIAIPMYSYYNASKYAIEGLMESLRYEVAQFNIKVKVIEPGQIETRFFKDSKDEVMYDAVYEDYTLKSYALLNDIKIKKGKPEEVAECIVKAALSRSAKFHYPVAGGAKELVLIRKLLPDFIWDAVTLALYK